jgi:hypothetical protein
VFLHSGLWPLSRSWMRFNRRLQVRCRCQTSFMHECLHVHFAACHATGNLAHSELGHLTLTIPESCLPECHLWGLFPDGYGGLHHDIWEVVVAVACVHKTQTIA